jgi:endonuclease/exonuclease/phosphatase family metal-dependent hydrolase
MPSPTISAALTSLMRSAFFILMLKLLLALLLATILSSPATASSLTVGTFNVRYENSGDAGEGNGWEQRAPVIASLIRFHDFDLLGTQEGFLHQMDDLQKQLPGYKRVLYGRDDGKRAGETATILYRSERFQEQDKGRFWLSETPDKPSKGWDASLPRICTWAKLRDKSTQHEFFCFNVHFDHRGAQSRKEGASLLLRRIDAIAGDTPTLLLGDFNAAQESEPWKILHHSERLDDAHELAKDPYVLNGTANAFDPNAFTGSRIDHIFVPAEAKITRFGVLTDSYRAPRKRDSSEKSSGNFPSEVGFRDHRAHLPSDHFPVLVELEWEQE